jgi:protein-L-isoaspartate O-methyltransferase
MEDSYQHKGLRKKLVEEIHKKGIRDENVLAAIGKVPRHLFMDSGFIKFAYRDQAFPVRPHYPPVYWFHHSWLFSFHQSWGGCHS